MEQSDVLSILIASDVHLGYAEKDPIRGDDSFHSFEEVLSIARARQVDMVLLAGDLFHDNKPSRKSLMRCMQLLRDYCLGEREVQMDVVSDPSTHFHHKNRTVNYEDPNYNVQLPVFSIHGNHDDPAGDGGLAALDLLSTANLVNYFGRANDVEKISLAPVLIRKGRTKFALYGLGHVRDERLARSFEHNSVTVARPESDPDEWFSVMVVHQNRQPRGVGPVLKGYIKDGMLPSCMDLVIWGHEHECQDGFPFRCPTAIAGGMHALAESSENQFIVMQPGSTVATSLVEGEAKPKHVALLQIRGEEFKMEAVPLRSVRPFAIKELVLRDFDEQYELHREEGMMRLFEDQVNELLAQLAERTPEGAMEGHIAQLHAHPLVRLKVDYSGYSTCNPQKFGQRFVDKVANPKDILLFQRTKVRRMQERAAALEAGGASSDQTGENEEEDASNTIQCLVAEFLHNTKSGQLRLLSEAELNQAVFHEFVLKDNKGAIAARVNAALKRTQTYLEQELSRDALPIGREQREQAVEERMRRHGAPPDEALAVDRAPLGPVEDAIRVIARARARSLTENPSDVSGFTRSLEDVYSPARGSSRSQELSSTRPKRTASRTSRSVLGALTGNEENSDFGHQFQQGAVNERREDANPRASTLDVTDSNGMSIAHRLSHDGGSQACSPTQLDDATCSRERDSEHIKIGRTTGSKRLRNEDDGSDQTGNTSAQFLRRWDRASGEGGSDLSHSRPRPFANPRRKIK